jgi:hypothetical protein
MGSCAEEYLSPDENGDLPESLVSHIPIWHQENSPTPDIHGISEGKNDAVVSDPAFEISDVLEYQPRKGYLVHWKGFSVDKSTWQRPGDMPSYFKERMIELRKLYNSSVAENSKHSTVVTKQENYYHKREPRDSNKKKHGEVAGLSVSREDEETWFTIDRVLEYDKKKGYLVSWLGFGPESNSWQKTKDMPHALHDCMKRLREGSTNAKFDSEDSRTMIENIPRPSAVGKRNIRIKRKECTNASEKHKKSKGVIEPINPSPELGAWDVIPKRVIHSVVQYNPTRGILVHWKNCSQTEDSWLPEEQVGDSFRYQILLAKERFVDNILGAQSAPAALLSANSTPDRSSPVLYRSKVFM